MGKPIDKNADDSQPKFNQTPSDDFDEFPSAQMSPGDDFSPSADFDSDSDLAQQTESFSDSAVPPSAAENDLAAYVDPIPAPQPAPVSSANSQYSQVPPGKSTKPKSNAWLIVLLIGVLVVIAAVIAAVFFYQKSTRPVQVGECVLIGNSSNSSEVNFERVSCNESSKLNYRVAKIGTGDARCDTDLPYTNIQVKRGDDNEEFFCLAPNFAKDKCYTEGVQYEEKNCSDTSEQMFKIVEKSESSDLVCPSDSHKISYPDLNVSYCLIVVGEAAADDPDAQ